VRACGGQLWGQNMQDLGICGGEGDPCEGFSMADIDLSFDNYKDIFSSTQGLSSWSSNDIEAAASCTPMGQDTVGENQCEHMQSIPELELLEVNNVRFSCLTVESICLCCISVSFFRLMCSTKRDIEPNAFTDTFLVTNFGGMFSGFLQGAMTGGSGGPQTQGYKGESAGQGPGPPPSPEMSEVGMVMGAAGLSSSNMESLQLVSQPTGSSLSLPLSGLSGDSSDYHECTAASSMFLNADPHSWGPTSPDSGAVTQARNSAMLRYKEKKKIRKYATKT